MTDDTAHLVEAARGGDRTAFGELYFRYARTVHGILLAHGSRVDVEDLVQDVFVVVAVLSLVNARTALAGPPLLCHPYEIGAAPSLPWQGHEWWPGRADYTVASLVADTAALLTPSTPVIVRMETMRRAAIYATRDRSVAQDLVNAVIGKARALDASGHPDALAWLDAAYLAEALREVTDLAGMSNSNPFAAAVRNVQGLTADLDGYALIQKSVALRPDDPSIQFAAALIARRENGRDEYAARARSGADRDALLARNLDHIY